jgi:hypothetical protein
MCKPYPKIAEDATSDEILSFLHTHVDKKAKVVTINGQTIFQ